MRIASESTSGDNRKFREKARTAGAEDLVWDILIPAFVTGIILFCLMQMGVTHFQFPWQVIEPGYEPIAISAFVI